MDLLNMFCKRTVIAGLLAILPLASSYPTYRGEIPNGDRVPDPCNASNIWNGVGHENILGGGSRNPFGLAFHASGKSWTTALCYEDSDGDGRTNGEELGDPDCTWSKGKNATLTSGLSHPGVCEPLDSELCESKNTFLSCEKKGFECAAIDAPDVIEHVVKISESQVPAKETTYMCQVLDLPVDKDYHVVAMKPQLDNENVIHHMLAYGCTDDASITDDLNTPTECFMSSTEGCSDIIAIWAVGAEGLCYHGDAGFRVGLTSYKRVILEVHWNNPDKITTYRDGSGMALYLTPNLRPFDAGMLMYGQGLLIIPPKRDSYVINGTCSSQCTKENMGDSVNIVGALNHMHYLGSSALSQIRHHETGEVTTLAEDKHYSYDTPVFYMFEKAVVMEPGDELDLMCEFRSTSRDRTTFSGEATNDEMCYTFLMYYPKQNMQSKTCVAQGPVSPCEWENPVVAGCDMKYLDITNPETQKIGAEVSERCMVGYCLDECKEYTKELLKNPCYQSELKFMFQEGIRTGSGGADQLAMMQFWYKMDSCLAEIAKEKGCSGQGDWKNPSLIGGAQRNGIVSVVTVITWIIALLI